MAVDLAGFVAAYPEFAKTGDAQISARLAQVELCVSPDTFGLKRDVVVMLRLADALATSPLGRDAQLAAGEQPAATTYRKALWELMLGAGFANPDARLGTLPDEPLALIDEGY